ncbi:MAG: nitrate reductase [Gammaproteobacteria bacterium]
MNSGVLNTGRENPRTVVRTTCPYCGVGCGVRAVRTDIGTLQIEGDPEHPANRGALCTKGRFLADTVGMSGRLLRPEIDGEAVDWSVALDHVAHRFSETIRRHGARSVAFYLSGQMLTEDYYVANKLMKGFIGSPHIDTNSRLCMSSTVIGHQRAFGEDVVPGSYEDIELADLIVLAGSNAAWCHPVLFQRIRNARERRRNGPRVVVIDPRRTPSCDLADLHLAIEPGSDAALFNGLLLYLAEQGFVDRGYIDRHTEGFEEALAAARSALPTRACVSDRCGVSVDQLSRFYHWFATTPRTMTLFSQGINQSSSGSDKVNSIINCHLATGRVGKPGSGPFSLTGQTNAMGGREVGGLATQLAAHLELGNPRHHNLLRRFWQAPNLVTGPGHKAVDLFRAVERGEIKALWIMATNPVVSMPDADRVRRALEAAEFVVVSECAQRTDTTALAHVRLPAATWGEKDGTTTNSERRISRQRAFLDLPGDARPDWWIISQVARRMGYGPAFAYTRPAEIFREHAALSALENDGARCFDIGALGGISDGDYDALSPVQWPVSGTALNGTERLFADGRFATPNGRARFITASMTGPIHRVDESYPLVLNSGRIRDQWHTLSRTGHVSRLSTHSPEPFVEIHSRDAERYRVEAGGLAAVTSRWGSVLLRVVVTSDQRPDSLFVPMHWNGEFASRARVDSVVNPVTDATSGQPESKYTPVRIEPVALPWEGFLLTRRTLHLEGVEYWVRVKQRRGWLYHLAGHRPAEGWLGWLRRCVGEEGEWLQYQDPACHRQRVAHLVEERLEEVLFLGDGCSADRVDHLLGLMERPRLEGEERMALLAGSPGEISTGFDRILCTCHDVRESAIRRVIVEQGLCTPEAIGQVLGAGTGCGSCRGELRGLIEACDTSSAA